jgi:uncharacterized membrane protein YvbJ
MSRTINFEEVLMAIEKCPVCGVDVSDNAKYCSNCGCSVAEKQQECGSNKHMTIFCRNCGSENVRNGLLCKKCNKNLWLGIWNFCPFCGSPRKHILDKKCARCGRPVMEQIGADATRETGDGSI